MAEDGSPKAYPRPPRERSKKPTEAAVLGADDAIPKSEATVTSEGDRVAPLSRMPEGDSTAASVATARDRLKLEDAPPEKQILAPAETANSTAGAILRENFLAVKTGSLSAPLGTVSLTDFSSSLAREDPGSRVAEVEDAPAPRTGEPEGTGTVHTSPTEPGAPDEEASVPGAEVPPCAEKDSASSPASAYPAQEQATETDPVAGEDEPGVESRVPGSEEKVLAELELTRDVGKGPEQGSSDGEAPDGTSAWEEEETPEEAEAHSLWLAAAESRYDFLARAPGTESLEGDAAASAGQGARGSAPVEAVVSISEPLPADGPAPDAPSCREEPPAADSGVFKLLKEDPDDFLM